MNSASLDKPRHHTAKDGVYGARGARLTHSQNSDAARANTAQDEARNVNRWMILMKRKLKERTHS